MYCLNLNSKNIPDIKLTNSDWKRKKKDSKSVDIKPKKDITQDIILLTQPDK